MKEIIITLFIGFVLISCESTGETEANEPDEWKKRMAEHIGDRNLDAGSTFLSIYSRIYQRDEENHFELTSTVSMHNPNALDSIFVDRAVYYNTEGEAVRTYFYNPIYIRPMETVQIVIPVMDKEGGSGANFIFDWRKKPNLHEPLFEAVMISSIGNNGISFITEGKRLK